MTTVTYADLDTLASVADGDLLAGWRGAGPLKTYTALIVKAYMAADSLPLAGGTMTGPLKLANGSEGAPALSFGSEATTGIYRSGAGNLDVSILGVRRLNLSASGLNVYGTLTAQALAGPLNGSVGGVTPAAGAFTTLAASGVSSLSGGAQVGAATKTGDYTLVAGDAGKVLRFATNGATLTLPAGLTAGHMTKIVFTAAGKQLTISAGAGASVTFADGIVSPMDPTVSVEVVNVGSDAWYVCQ